MPYGVKRGLKNPGDYSLFDIVGLAMSGAAGILAALVTDYQQSAESSALYTLNHWAVSLGNMMGYAEIPLWWVIAGLVVVGAGSIFYFQPITRQGAFAQGFGLLAVLMTAVPADLAAGLENIRNDENLPGLSSNDTDIASIRQTSYPGVARSKATNATLPPTAGGIAGDRPAVTKAAFQRRNVAKYEIRLVLKFEGGLDGDVNNLIRRGLLRGRLHNDDTDVTYNLLLNAGGNLTQRGDTLIIEAGVPARSDEARLWVRIECAGHRIEEQSAVARLGQPLEWRMTIRESSTPLFIQRLNRVYRY